MGTKLRENTPISLCFKEWECTYYLTKVCRWFKGWPLSALYYKQDKLGKFVYDQATGKLYDYFGLEQLDKINNRPDKLMLFFIRFYVQIETCWNWKRLLEKL